MNNFKELYYRTNPWWEKRDFSTGIERPKYSKITRDSFSYNQVELLTGGRRTGKTTLLRQAIKELLKTTPANEVFYLQADMPGIVDKTITAHVDDFRALFGHPYDGKIYLFIDEIQCCEGWDREIKSMYDLGFTKIFITGSTSYLIESRGSSLTGRQRTTNVRPLDYNEYLSFRGLKVSPAETYLHNKYLEDYMMQGGYPSVALGAPEGYMEDTIQDIINRDIIRLFRARNSGDLMKILGMTAAGLATRVSFHRFAKALGSTVKTVKKYAEYFEKAFLVSFLEKYSASLKDRIYSNKKIYLADTSIKNLFFLGTDFGARAENLLFNFLKENFRRLGYFAAGGREVDFIIETPDGAVPVESKYVDSLEKDDVRLAGLRLYVKKFRPKRAYVVTRSFEEEFETGKTAVKAVPLWKVLTGQVLIK